MIGIVKGTGSYVPSRILENEDIANLVDTNDAWIRERTGVARRHIISDETTVSMAGEAGKRALEDAGVLPEEVDLILVSTISSEVILPCVACEVQKYLGAFRATCFDLSAACTGFVLAYNTAQAYLKSDIYQTVLIIGSESMSNLTNWTDRGTCILFGDGAGAMVLQAGEGACYTPVTHSEGGKGAALTCRSRQDASRLSNNVIHYPEAAYKIQMDGRAVFQFAVKKVPDVIQEVIAKNKIAQQDIDWYILHQANQRIVEGAAKRLKEPLEKFPMNLKEYGNTSSASIPILLDEMKKDGRLKSGQKVIMAGFGAGLTWGASLLEWK